MFAVEWKKSCDMAWAFARDSDELGEMIYGTEARLRCGMAGYTTAWDDAVNRRDAPLMLETLNLYLPCMYKCMSEHDADRMKARCLWAHSRVMNGIPFYD